MNRFTAVSLVLIAVTFLFAKSPTDNVYAMHTPKSNSSELVIRGNDVLNWIEESDGVQSHDKSVRSRSLTVQKMDQELSIHGVPQGFLASRLISMNGQIVATHAGFSSQETFIIPLKEKLAPGIYSVRIESNGQAFTEKVVIK